MHANLFARFCLFARFSFKTDRQTPVGMVPPLVSRECFGLRHRQIDQHQIIGLLTRWSGRLAKYINSPRSVWTWKSASVISKCTDRSYSDNTG
jgi:hypothetical protein